jgi:hypothetical protein
MAVIERNPVSGKKKCINFFFFFFKSSYYVLGKMLGNLQDDI